VKFESTHCPTCGASFRKRRLAQRYCKDACRKRAYDRREGRVSTDPRFIRKRQIEAQKSVGKAFLYADSEKRRNPAEKANKNSTLQGTILQSSLFASPTSWPIDIVGGKGGLGRLPRALFDAILAAEMATCQLDEEVG